MRDKITRLNPAALHETPGYHHITVVEAGRTAYLSGQCPLDPTGAIAPDLPSQIAQVAANSLVALAAVGAGPDHVVKAVIYVVTAEQPVLAEAWRQFHTTDLAPAFSTASTLLGLAQLGFPGQLVELDLIASIPD